jgi:hypothetical protein
MGPNELRAFMLSDTGGCLVGLIVIETLHGERGPGRPCGERDSTLAEFLAYLARPDANEPPRGDEQPACGMVSAVEAGGVGRDRFGSKVTRRLARQSRISADLKGLASQLDRLAVQALRNLAGSR